MLFCIFLCFFFICVISHLGEYIEGCIWMGGGGKEKLRQEGWVGGGELSRVVCTAQLV